ncbi:MAG: condensation domain-containing protein [Methylobacter sp.]
MSSSNKEALFRHWVEIIELIVAHDNIRPQDNLFDLGVDSINLLDITELAEAKGIKFGGIEALLINPSIDELVESSHHGGPILQSPEAAGDSHPLLPTQADILSLPNPGTFTTAPKAYQLCRDTPPQAIAHALEAVIRAHPALRTVLTISEGVTVQKVIPPDEAPTPLEVYRSTSKTHAELAEEMPRLWRRLSSFCMEHVLPIRVCYVTGPLFENPAILFATHHLASDAYSEKIIHRDFTAAFAGHPVQIERQSLLSWAHRVHHMVHQEPETACSRDYWLNESQKMGWRPIPQRENAAKKLWRFPLTLQDTGEGLFSGHFNLSTILLGTAILQLWTMTTVSALWAELVDSGRLTPGANLDGVVGCLYYTYPVHLSRPDSRQSLENILSSLEQTLLAVPQRGFGYAALRWLSPDPDVRESLGRIHPVVTLNIRGSIAENVSSGLQVIKQPDLKWNFSRDQQVSQNEKPLRIFVEPGPDGLSGYILADSGYFNEKWAEDFAVGFSKKFADLRFLPKGTENEL